MPTFIELGLKISKGIIRTHVSPYIKLRQKDLTILNSAPHSCVTKRTKLVVITARALALKLGKHHCWILYLQEQFTEILHFHLLSFIYMCRKNCTSEPECSRIACVKLLQDEDRNWLMHCSHSTVKSSHNKAQHCNSNIYRKLQENNGQGPIFSEYKVNWSVPSTWYP